ncbi:hypothetical protein [Thermomonas flagellata]|uniref:hypothetical protein n=1 Tax=Thermomonas flagellata TaxID=2888524 RepID=UPI001F044824|nr:hypothetical protein [Thermomonas flagellata]
MIDGAFGFGEIKAPFGSAVIDMASGGMLVNTESGSFQVGLSDVVAEASRYDSALQGYINSQLDFYFMRGGVSLYAESRGDSHSLNGPREYCNFVGCDPMFSGWYPGYDDQFFFELFQKRPPGVPPAPRPPSHEECVAAFEDVVEARLAVDQAEEVCKLAARSGSKAKGVACGLMLLYGAIKTSQAANRGAGCAVPPEPPPPPPEHGYYTWWGWTN